MPDHPRHRSLAPRPHRRRSSRSRRERGAAAVELALVAPVLLTFVFGIVEFGLAFSAQASVSAAARQGARTMAVGSTAAAARTAAKTAAPGISLTDSQISVSPTTCVGVANGVNTTVTVTYPYPFLTGFFGSGLTLTGTGVMRCEG